MVAKRGKAATAPRPAPDWSWVELEDITDESELTQEHLRKAIGLDSARPCRNKFQAEPQPEPNMIVIDLADDTDDQDAGSRKEYTRNKKGVKGKGKSSTKRHHNGEVWGPPCTGTWCQDNLLCLNHLGGKAVSRVALSISVADLLLLLQWLAKGTLSRIRLDP